ncbi:hypothetical protein HMSSN036_62450 [Paenibacillus macerans]|nr:hypothetical protein HMSSN036_62450 [Paenibacillus macerans]
MKIIHFFLQIAVLTGFYGVGALVQTLSKAPIPGSIFGLVLLFLALKLRIVPAGWLEHGATFMQNTFPYSWYRRRLVSWTIFTCSPEADNG